ncbi:MAG TPA: Rieske (2Fe-2S) protein [Chloroflexota bacterium]|nr:Rieske (2Fe-2S) protein [Chloroflexota bacterium]
MNWLNWLRRLSPWHEPVTPLAPRNVGEQGDHGQGEDIGGFDPDDIGHPVSPERRRFFARVGIACAGIGAAIAGVPVVGFLFSPVLRQDPTVWRRLGSVDDFRIGETVKVSFLDPSPLPWAGFASHSAAWLRRINRQEFIAFSIYCTHTGCPVAWTPGAGLFICPCHGGAFARDGAVASGPPQAPLPIIPVRVRAGQVEIMAGPAAHPSTS